MIATMNSTRARSSNCMTLASEGPRQERVHTSVEGITYKVAQSWEEREAAFRLLYEAYRSAGLVESNPMGMRVLPFHLDDSSNVFIAVRNGTVIYTVSLIRDDERGLPLQEIYPADVDEMRETTYLAEVSCLAGRAQFNSKRERFEIFVNLIGLMTQYARRHFVDRLLVAVHPRHVKFYRSFFGFDIFGEEMTYGAVRGNPAIGCVHDFRVTDRTGYRMRDQVYQVDYAPWELCSLPMREEEHEWFGIAAEFAGCEVVPMAS